MAMRFSGFSKLVKLWTAKRDDDESLAAAVFELSREMLAMLDSQGRIHRLNPPWVRILGDSSTELIGRPLLDMIAPVDADAARRWLAELERTPAASATAELRCLDRHGVERRLSCIGQTVAGSSEILVVAQELDGDSARPAAYRDPVTGVLNRLGFMDQLRHSCERSQRGASGPFAVLLLDLDRFKQVNDGYGHSVGDGLLIAVARRLQDCLRPGDSVARFGGDEFAVLLERLRSDDAAVHVAERVKLRLREPVMIEGQEIVTSASIGIALSEANEADAERLLRHADAAMYRAKARGKGHYALFDSDLRRSTLERQLLGSEVETALVERQFRIFYQPRIDLDSGRICGFEALLRWQHPRHGLLRPDAFLKVVDDTGHLVEVERWLLGEACGQLKTWNDGVAAQRPIVLSVNLCEREFHQADLTAFLHNTLETYHLEVDRLQVEVTESSLLDHSSNSLRRINGLHKLGVAIFIDDFGSGYSSLSILHRFPVRGVKIDHTFVQQLPHSSQVTEIVRSISVMGRGLGLDVVAEGVENHKQLELLREFGCAFAEGPLFSSPLTSEAANQLLIDHPSW